MDSAGHRRGRVDRVAVTGALVALAGCSLLPFLVYRANRIATGSPRPIGTGGAAAAVLVVVAVYALAAALWRPGPGRGSALRVIGAAMAVVLAWALGSGATTLVGGASGAQRASIGPGAWLVFLGAAVVWFAGGREAPAGPRSWGPGLVALVSIVGLAAAGVPSDLSIAVEYRVQAATFWQAVGTHAALVGAALAIAIVVGLPLGVLSARVGWVRAVTLGAVGLIQTVPSPALLGLLILPLAALGLPGIGPLPALIALTLYALLPIVRNTYLGITGVDPAIIDVGRGMGMSRGQLLLRVEAPLALPLFIEGLRAGVVMIVGIAAVVAFIGVGTLGVFVFEGWGGQADDLILLGAVPMVVLAVAADTVLRWLGRVATSPGIRVEVS